MAYNVFGKAGRSVVEFFVSLQQLGIVSDQGPPCLMIVYICCMDSLYLLHGPSELSRPVLLFCWHPLVVSIETPNEGRVQQNDRLANG